MITRNQCGFRRGISTNISIAKFLFHVYHGLNSNKYGLGIFLDLQKAFDTVDHRILLAKLSHYGIRGTPYNLIKSFLSNRMQYVKIKNSKSSFLPVSLGTPQGSILSPLLFIIFINDFENCSNNLFFNFFADDTSLYMSGDNLHSLYMNVNMELKQVERWISANRLCLNINKTVYLLLSGKKPVETIPNIFLFDQPIQRLSQTKFLGVLIDDKLTWKPHINFVLGKISRMVGILSKVKNNLTFSSLKSIYYSLVYCHLQYGIVFWGAASQQEVNKIFIAQKKIIRLMEGAPYRAHSEPLFKKNNFIKVQDIRRLEMAKFIFADIRLFNFFNFEPRQSAHTYPTRNSSSIATPKPRTNILLKSVFYEGITFYNSLSTDIKNSSSMDIFKAKVKRYLIGSNSSFT